VLSLHGTARTVGCDRSRSLIFVTISEATQLQSLLLHWNCALCRQYRGIWKMKMLHALLVLLTLCCVESLRLQSLSVASGSRNSVYAILPATLSFEDTSRNAPYAALRRTALWHATGGTGDEPYLQHICPSCSYVYDESKGFKKRHPPGESLL
jgi:hypothetical protein